MYQHKRLLMISSGLAILLFLGACSPNEIDEEAMAKYIYAKRLYENNNLIESENSFKQLSDDYPHFYQARFMYAKSLFFQEEYEEAYNYLTGLTNELPQFFDAQLLLAQTLMILDLWEEAEIHLREMLSYNSQDPRVLYQLALTRLEGNKLADALDLLKQSSKSGQELSQIYLTLGQIYNDFGLAEEAIDALNKSATLFDNTDPRAAIAASMRDELIQNMEP